MNRPHLGEPCYFLLRLAGGIGGGWANGHGNNINTTTPTAELFALRVNIRRNKRGLREEAAWDLIELFCYFGVVVVSDVLFLLFLPLLCALWVFDFAGFLVSDFVVVWSALDPVPVWATDRAPPRTRTHTSVNSFFM